MTSGRDFRCCDEGTHVPLTAPRFPEPGLFGVVEGAERSGFYLRDSLEGEADWTRVRDGRRFRWADIPAPLLHRDGLEL